MNVGYETVVRQVLNLPRTCLETVSQYILSLDGNRSAARGPKLSIDDFVGILPRDVDYERDRAAHLEAKHDAVH